MSEVAEPKRARRHNSVSKVLVDLEGKRYRFILTRQGLVVRRWHCRKTKLLSFSTLLDICIDQRTLL